MSTTLYHGNCHCGAHRFRVSLPALEHALTCDCSLCHKLGALWAVPGDGAYAVTRGERSAQTEYASAAVKVQFCAECGITTTGEHTTGPLKGKLLVNIRTLLNVNPFSLKIEEVSTELSETPTYEAPSFAGPKPDVLGENTELYTGSCHCRAVSFALRAKPLAQEELKEDNCSICVRRAWVGIYPRSAQVSLIGRDHTKDYVYGRRFAGSPFCTTCGVHVHTNLYGPPAHVVASWPPARQAMVREKLDLVPLNLRTFDGLDLGTLSVQREDEGTEGYVLEE